MSVISNLRYYVSKLFPNSLKWKLIRLLPEINNFTGKFFQGIRYAWEEDKDFYILYQQVKERSLLDKKRGFMIYQAAKNSENIEGNMAEIGVYRGASAFVAGKAVDFSKKFYLFDTFEGLPKTDPKNDPYWKEGDMDEPDYQEVKNFLSQDCFSFHKGYFPETAKEIGIDEKFAFVHIDGDIYQTTVDACKFFYPRMSLGAYMMFDDYGFLSCPGVKKAVDDFFTDKKETPLYVATGQCLVVKQ